MKRIFRIIKIFALLLSICTFITNGCVYAFGDTVYMPNLSYIGDNEVTFIVEVEGGPALTNDKLKKGFSLNSITNEIISEQNKVIDSIKEEVSDKATIGYTYTSLFNGFSLDGKEAQLEAIKNIDGVKNVYISRKIPFKQPMVESSGEAVDVDSAYDSKYTGEGQAIAVIDAFCDIEHDIFKGDIKNPKFSEEYIDGLLKNNTLNTENISTGVYRNEKFPFVYNYAAKSLDVDVCESDHGTHVAGIAAGNNGKSSKGTTFTGVAPDAQIVFMNIMQDGYIADKDVFAALNDSALIGVDVINMSLGDEYSDSAIDYVYDTIVKNARESGISVAAAAGNSSRKYKEKTPLTANIDYSTVGSPGVSKDVTAVASAYVKSRTSTASGTEKIYTKRISSYSSWGVDSTLELKPEVSAPGESIYCSIPNNKYIRMSGTSMASPYIAGAYALTRQYYKSNPYIAAYNGYTGGEFSDLIENVIMNSAEILRYENGVPYSPRVQGAGLINFKNLLNSKVLLTGNSDKAKISLGEIDNSFDVSFKITNISNETVRFDDISIELLTDGYTTKNGENYVADSVKIENSFINNLPTEISVAPGKEYTFTAKIALDNEFLKENKKIFTNGFFIDGFVVLNTQDKSQYASMPFTGFYGGWKTAPIFDKTRYDEGGSILIDPNNADTSGTYLRLINKNNSKEMYFAGINNCDKTILNKKYISFSNKSNFDLQIHIQSLRAASKYGFIITDKADKTVWGLIMGNKNAVFGKYDPISIGLSNNKFSDIAEGDYNLKIDAYGVGSEEVSDTFTLPLAIDNTAPQVISAAYNEDTKRLIVVAKDNQYLSYIKVKYDDTFTELPYNETEQNEKEQTVTKEVILDDVKDPSSISVKVFDYAMNIGEKEVKIEKNNDRFEVKLLTVCNVNNEVTATFNFVNSGEAADADIIAGFYDDKSKLIAVDKIDDYSIEKGSVDLTFKENCDIQKIKSIRVFIWNPTAAIPLDNAKTFMYICDYLNE